MKFTTAIAALAATAIHGVVAAPSSKGANVARDVWDPKILSPNSGTTWISGNTYTVVWDTSDAPVNITDTIGFITIEAGGDASPFLLAWDFSLLDGQVEVTAPNVLSNDNFQIVLFGDSGNLSEDFTIEGPFNP